MHVCTLYVWDKCVGPVFSMIFPAIFGKPAAYFLFAGTHIRILHTPFTKLYESCQKLAGGIMQETGPTVCDCT